MTVFPYRPKVVNGPKQTWKSTFCLLGKSCTLRGMDETVHAVGKKNEYKLDLYYHKFIWNFPLLIPFKLYFMDYEYYNFPANTIEIIYYFSRLIQIT